MSQLRLKNIRNVHLGICLLVFLFSTMAYFQGKKKLYFNLLLDKPDIFLYILFIGIIAVLVGFLLFKLYLKGINSSTPVEEKMTKYYTGFALKISFFSSAGFVNVVGFQASSNSMFLITNGLVLLLLIASRPTKDSVIEALNLSYPDTENI